MQHEPKSGSDIIEEIEEITGWKPSHGSIYPLLDRLSRKGLITPIESEVPGVKPYTLTDKGREKIKQDKQRLDIRERYHSLQRIYWKIIREMDENIYQASMKLLNVLEDINIDTKEQEVLVTISSILNQAAKEIEEIKKSSTHEGDCLD